MLKLIGLFALLFIINKLIYGEREQEEPIARQRPRGNTGRRGNHGGGVQFSLGYTLLHQQVLQHPFEPIAGQYNMAYTNP